MPGKLNFRKSYSRSEKKPKDLKESARLCKKCAKRSEASVLKAPTLKDFSKEEYFKFKADFRAYKRDGGKASSYGCISETVKMMIDTEVDDFDETELTGAKEVDLDVLVVVSYDGRSETHPKMFKISLTTTNIKTADQVKAPIQVIASAIIPGESMVIGSKWCLQTGIMKTTIGTRLEDSIPDVDIMAKLTEKTKSKVDFEWTEEMNAGSRKSRPFYPEDQFFITWIIPYLSFFVRMLVDTELVESRYS
ncbi:hypothetical protein ADUPG1_008319 [Aduncisulcus paluster]|uniref:Uncharacterized protein n=1 Tax=Aduncisulcus paluster TaxID=2918883 RepID=A0ABQ5KRI9_9EUKA|nr:hypothetical protein ADUPG1_008319 [Aduncisulcus paluster]